jgi:signal transduction histidine kinase/CheY-like chemotaxis protein
MHWPWQNKKERWEHDKELYYQLADIVFILDLEGKIAGIIKSNASHPIPDSMIGHYLRDILGADQGLKGAQAMREALALAHRVVYEYHLGEGENTYYFRAQIIPIPRAMRGREERVLWLAFDATERKLHEASLWMRNELLEGVLNARISLMGDASSGSSSLLGKSDKPQLQSNPKALDESLKIIGEATKAERVYILEHYQTPYYQVLSLQREWCAEGVPSQMQNPKLEQIEYEDLFPGWLQSILKAGYKYFKLEELPEKFRHTLRVSDTQWILMLPVYRDRMLWGILGIEFHRPHRKWETDEVRILQSMTETIGGWVRMQETQKQLQMTQLEAEKANRAKSEFLAVISHELRTPMNAILGYSQLLRASFTNAEQKEQIGFIERSGRTLLDLINNILDFSKIESKEIELEVISFSLEQVIIETLETCSIKAKEKGVALDYSISKGLPHQLLGDPHRIKQILLNLVNNAVKFTPQGSVRVEVTHTRDDNRVFLRFGVRDTGIGIEPDKVSRLFKAFSQADSSTTRQYGGTGLGLAIAKRLVENMGGKIWVESAVGKGTVFLFTLQVLCPAEISATPHAQNRATTPPIITGDFDATFGQRFPMRILLAEDDPMNQKLAMKLLDKLGYSSVTVAFDGLEALKRINEGQYDLVLADLQMPRLDGIAMTQRLRMGECGEAKSKIPVVAVTAYAMNEDRDRCMAAGMNSFVRKPIQVAELKEALIMAYHQRPV